MVALLTYRAWADLHATAHAHGLPFHTKQSKAQAYDRKYYQLVQAGMLRRRFKCLTDDEHSALVAVQAAGGTLPLHTFKRAYGAIRIWRPWRDGIPRQPWKHSPAVAEKLWYWGFIEIARGRPDRVMLPDEVLALLPPLPTAAPVAQAIDTGHPSPRETLCIDLAALLGALLYEDVRPLHGRWLPPSALRAINGRLRIQANLDGVRSERRTGRLRFLHYVVEAAGLVGVQAGVLKPTIQAWQWLKLPPGERWQAVWEAVDADLRARNRLWDRYHLPLVGKEIWEIVADHLHRLVPGSTYDRDAFVRTIQPHLPTLQPLDDPIGPLLEGPLAWLGLVNSDGSRLTVTPCHFAGSQNATLALRNRQILITLPDVPHLHPLVTCCAWARVEGRRLHVDAQAVGRALETGGDTLQVASALAELTGEPLPPDVFEQIETWSRAASALTLRQVTLLTARDPTTLPALRSDWRLRPLLGQPLSPHHLAILPGREEALLTKLARRGYPVVSHIQPAADTNDHATVSPEMAEYLWLAVRVYQKLESLIEVDIAIPAAARSWLTSLLPNGSADGLEGESDAIIERLVQAIRGKPASPAVVRQTDPAAVRAAVQSAYEQRGALTIEYFSPARGEKTIRTIEPVLLYERQGAEYVEAWCRLDEATRTFRVDRILRVMPGE